MAMENDLDRGLSNHRFLGTVYKGANLAGNILARGRIATGISGGRIAAPNTCLTVRLGNDLRLREGQKHVGWWKTCRGTVSQTLGHRGLLSV